MPICPFCKAHLSRAAFHSGRCPKCRQTLSPDDAQDRRDFPTGPDSDDSSSAGPPPEDPSELPPEKVGRKTADDRRFAETIQPGAASEVPPKKQGRKTADDRRFVETLQGTPSGAALSTQDDRGTADDRRIMQTLEAGGLEPEVVQRITQLWSGTLDPDTAPRTSIKSDVQSIAREADLVIQSQILREGKQKDAEKADYELISRLGEGGMGIVYAARQAAIDRTVAVKMLKPRAAGDEIEREKFLSEAVVTGELEHPNIVPIYNLGKTESGHLFYSMKRVQGTPWDTVISEKSFAENLEILMKVADAVALAHSRGVIHRDLKPENVMLGDYGEVLLMDWGLAVSMGVASRGIGMGGTPAYMAPEMAAGPIERIGFPSDIYLLGAILYEIIADQPPHLGKNVVQCLLAAAKNEIRPTEKSGELLDIALRAMATKPEDRYASVAEFQDAIREYRSHSESISLAIRAEEDLRAAAESDDYELYARARFGFQEALELWQGNTRASSGVSQASLAYATRALGKGDYDLGASLLNADNPQHAQVLQDIRAAQRERLARQHRLKTAKRVGVGLVLTIFAIVTGAFFWIQHEATLAREAETRAEGEAKAARAAETTAAEEAEAARAAEALADKEAKAARAAEALAAEEAETARAAEVIAEDRRIEAEKQTEIANQKTEEARVSQLAAEEAERLQKYEAYIAKIGLAAAKIDENSFDRAVALLNECPAELCNWEWGRLMHLCTRDVKAFDAQQPVDAVAYSPEGNRFATAGWGGVVRIWDAASGEQSAAISTGGEFVFAVAFSPDGQYLATGDNDRPNYVKIYDTQTGERVQALTGHKDAVLCVTYSRDGKRLLTTSYDNTARLWDLETGQSKEFAGHDWWVWSAAFSPDEKQIVTASQDGSAIVWSVETGEPGPRFLGHAGPVFSAAFSPNARDGYVATAGYDKRVLLWKPEDVKPFDFSSLLSEDPPERTPCIVLEGHAAAVCSVRFSSDGKFLLSGGNDNTVRLWDVETGKLLKTVRGHAGWVRSCVFSSDSQQVLSGSHDHQAKLWNIGGYQEIRILGGRVLEGHRDAILGASFSPDGQRIVTAGRDRLAKTWSTVTGRQLQEFREGHDFLATNAFFFPDGKKVVTAAADSTTIIWNVATGTQLETLEGTGLSAAVALSSDAQWILTGSNVVQREKTDGSGNAEKLCTPKIWDAKSGDLLRTLAAHHAEVTAVAISPDDTLMLTGDMGGQCRLWDAQTGEEKWRSEGHSRAITAACFLPDGKHVLTASVDNTVARWDVETGQELSSSILKHSDAVTSMALSPDGRYVLTACADRRVDLSDSDVEGGEPVERRVPVSTVRLWELANAEEIGKLAVEDEVVSSVAFSPDGRHAVTAGSVIAVSGPDGRRDVTADSEHVVRLWDLQTFEEVGDDGPGPFTRPKVGGSQVRSAIFSPNGAHVLTVGGTDVCLWDVKTGHEAMRARRQGSVASAHFSPDGGRIVTGSWDNTARIWNAETGVAELKLESGHTQFVNTAVFSPDGSMVLTAGDDQAVLWDAKTGEVHKTFRGHADRVRSAVFSSDQQRILTTSDDKAAWIWDVKSGQVLHKLAGHEQAVLWAAFSRDDSRVITAGEDTSAIIWDVTAEAKVLFRLEGHTAGVTSVAFSPDATRVITGSRDNTAKIWDAETGKEILTLKGHSEEITCVAFSPDGRTVLTASRDGTAVLWPTVDWRREAPPADPGQTALRISHAAPGGDARGVMPEG